MLSISCLRHFFATHVLEDGHDVRTVGPPSRGHHDVSTHVLEPGPAGIRSPADRRLARLSSRDATVVRGRRGLCQPGWGLADVEEGERGKPRSDPRHAGQAEAEDYLQVYRGPDAAPNTPH